MKPYRLRRLLLPVIIAYVVLAVLILGLFTLRSVKSHFKEQSMHMIQEHALVVRNILRQQPELPLDELQDYVRTLGRDASIRVTLIDEEGNVLADSEKAPELLDNHRDRPEIAEALTGNPEASVRYSDSLEYEMMYYAMPFSYQDLEGVLRTSFPLKELDSTLASIYLNFSLFGALFLGAAFVLVVMLISKIERPLSDVAETASRYSKLDFTGQKQKDYSIHEVQVLSDSLYTMAGELQKQFASIQHQRDELKAVLDSMSEAVIVLDGNLKIIEANPSAHTYFCSKKHRELYSLPIQTIIKSPHLHEILEKTHEDGQQRSIEINLKRSSYQINVTSLPADQHTKIRQIVLVCNDITTLMHLERVRKDFVANVSHELKTPITSIKGFSETLLEEGIENKELSQRFIEIIHRQSLRLQAIIQDLLTLSQLEQKDSDRSQFTSKLELLPVIMDGILICREKTQQLDRPVEVECDASLTVVGNAHLIEQALINLVENAMKYSDPSSPITIRCTETGNQVHITVEDRGYGIPRQDIPRIFERFYRVDKARSRDKGGTGLGLSIVKHIMLQHKGTVEVTSEEGEGSAFRLIFPM